MKKLLLTFVALVISVNIAAQNDDASDDRINEIGLSVSDLLNGAFQFKYERMVGEHISLSLGVGYKGDDGIIKLSELDRDKIKTDEITYSGIKLIPEVRYYVNKTTINSMDGFYFGAYFKYSNYTSDLDGTYISDSDESFIVEFDAKINVASVGFMVGYKLPINNRLSIDFLIAGPGAGFHKYSLDNKRDLPDEFYDDLNNALDQYSLFDFMNADFEFSNVKSDSDLVLPAFRYGITLGYSF